MAKRLLMMAVGLPLVLVACGGKPAPPAAAPPTPTQGASPTQTVEATPPQQAIEVCKLLPREDAEAIAGTPLDPGVEGPAHSPQCNYTGPVTGPVAQVEIYVGDGAKKILDIDRDDLKHPFAAVPGIADEAHEEENAIFLRKGTTWVAIRLVRLNDPAENRAPLRAAATKVAGRLS